jgi:hypothetical protein
MRDTHLLLAGASAQKTALTIPNNQINTELLASCLRRQVRSYHPISWLQFVPFLLHSFTNKLILLSLHHEYLCKNSTGKSIGC